MAKNIILIGYRGAGKSTIGKILAERMQLKFISTDEEIEKWTNKKISELVKEKGWNYFRTIEEQIVEKICKISGIVIATGGGTILSEKNRQNLKRNGKFIYLKCNSNIIAERIKKSDRPSLIGKDTITIEEIEQTLKEREKIYSELADFTVDTSSLTIEDVVEKIFVWLKQNISKNM